MSSKNKNLSEFIDLENSDLNLALENACKENFELRLKLSSGQLKETHQVRLNKRKIARLKTLIGQKRGSAL